MKHTFITALLLMGPAALAQDAKLVLASDVWPPFTDEQGQRSISFDLVGAALERMGIGSTFVVTEFDSVLIGLQQGRYNGSAALWKSTEREAELLFSNAYLQNQLILLGRKGSDPNVTSLSALEGSRIGLVQGYAYDAVLKAKGRNEIVYGATDQENLERLLAGSIDYMLVDRLRMEYLLKYETNDVSALLEFARVPILYQPLHFAIRRDTPNAAAIITGFNNEIRKMIADGSYNRILELNWVRADVDGNGTLELIYTGNEVGVEPPLYVYDIHDAQPGSAPDDYYVNGNLYATWAEIPEAYKVARPDPVVPPAFVPNDGIIKF